MGAKKRNTGQSNSPDGARQNSKVAESAREGPEIPGNEKGHGSEPRDLPETVDRRRASKQRNFVFGFRAYAAAFCATPATLLNTVVPAVAVYRGDVTLPNVMLSDVMASHPLYSAFYTWGFTISMAGVCFVFQEASTMWRRRLPHSTRADLDRFIVIMYTLCAPCLFGLVAFQYKHDMSLSDVNSSWGDMFTNCDFILWLVHASSTGVFFLACCWMSYIYMWKLKPALDEHQLMHRGDRFWRDTATLSVQLLTPFGVVIRFAHLLVGGDVIGVLLVLIEVALIQCFVVVAFAGIFRCMMELDAEDPMVLWESMSTNVAGIVCTQ